MPEMHFEDTKLGVLVWKKSHLLSLPKELRLEIWKWTLTDPSVPGLVVNIGREEMKLSQYMVTGKILPRVLTWLKPRRNCTINTTLLRTNRFIYEEALPLLYESVRFAPTDHQGMFPLFLDSISPFARSLIRHIKLHVPTKIYDVSHFGDPAIPLFHWAVTCAQVAKLGRQLRDVEVEGLWMDTALSTARTKRLVLYPLCKIKTRKIFGTNNDSEAKMSVAQAEVELEAKIALRRVQAEARNVADTTAISSQQIGHDDATRLKELIDHEEASSVDDENLIGEWDLISYRSCASTPNGRPSSCISKYSSDSWSNAASMIRGTEFT